MSKQNSSDYRKGSNAYKAEDGRKDERVRDRSPLRMDDRRETSHYSQNRQNDSRKQKLAFGFGKKSTTTTTTSTIDQRKGIQIKFGALSNPVTKPSTIPKPTVASVFNTDEDDDEPEEMPAEARMRMRNIGRETPTSAGPNSFGKTKQGFCDSKKIFEKSLKKAMEEANK
ncbi:PEST proteolytic signal-containing nuclear protein-like [Leptopilina boulardi]|uniref:PEST proteolytic signal-containing nuclear protein-like n=1 Tax=Leptopilina boulardi TaxID=63433 RepID=UPI0021F5AED8|nr:PEST proteolytic signal-containing nuclear protein-like [Leptopilina boulardi]